MPIKCCVRARISACEYFPDRVDSPARGRERYGSRRKGLRRKDTQRTDLVAMEELMSQVQYHLPNGQRNPASFVFCRFSVLPIVVIYITFLFLESLTTCVIKRCHDRPPRHPSQTNPTLGFQRQLQCRRGD